MASETASSSSSSSFSQSFPILAELGKEIDAGIAKYKERWAGGLTEKDVRLAIFQHWYPLRPPFTPPPPHLSSSGKITSNSYVCCENRESGCDCKDKYPEKIDFDLFDLGTLEIHSLTTGVQCGCRMRAVHGNTCCLDSAIVRFAEGLGNNTTLRSLKMNYGYIGDIGAQAIATALEKNNTLCSVTLIDDRIWHDGIRALAKALHTNTTLTSLNLKNTQNSVCSLTALAHALSHNSTLTFLELPTFDIEVETAQSIAAIFEHNSTILELNFNYSDFGKKNLKLFFRKITRRNGRKMRAPSSSSSSSSSL